MKEAAVHREIFLKLALKMGCISMVEEEWGFHIS